MSHGLTLDVGEEQEVEDTLLPVGGKPLIIKCTLNVDVTSPGITDPNLANNKIVKNEFKILVKKG